MFRRIADFEAEWDVERSSTARLLGNLTDESLAQRATPDGRSLGFLAWHITSALRETLAHTGLQSEGPGRGDPVPASAAVIAREYERASASVRDQVSSGWTDDMLEGEVEAFGRTFTRGILLEMLIRHQAHHRGQITILMRMAGLPVIGVYGPAREQWTDMGMEPHP